MRWLSPQGVRVSQPQGAFSIAPEWADDVVFASVGNSMLSMGLPTAWPDSAGLSSAVTQQGRAVRFDGATNSSSQANSSGLLGKTEFTLILPLRINAIPGTPAFICGSNSAAGTNPSILGALGINASGQLLGLRRAAGAAIRVVTASRAFAAGECTVAVVRAATAPSSRINLTIPGEVTSTNTSAGGGTFNGIYSDVSGLSGYTGTADVSMAARIMLRRYVTDAEALSLAANPWQLFEPERRIWVPVSAASGPITGDIGTGIEKDLGLALAGSMVGALGLASEADTALSLSGAQQAALGTAIEADTALALGGQLFGVVGVAAESDIAQALAGLQSGLLGTAAEANTALPLGGALVGSIGLAVESDTALALAPGSNTAVGTAQETDAALPLTGAMVGAIGMAVESGQSLALAGSMFGQFGIAADAEAALALSGQMFGAVGTAGERDLALALIAPPDFETEVPPERRRSVPAELRRLSVSSEIRTQSVPAELRRQAVTRH